MRSKIVRNSLRAAICCGIGLLLAGLGPTIVAGYWHLTHNRWQRFGIYEIQAPSPFIFRKKANGVELVRARAGFSPTFYQFESIQITKRNGEVDSAKWRDAALRNAQHDGYSGVKAYDLAFDGSIVACIERLAAGSQVRTSVLCANNGDIYIEYFGDEEGVSDMREILQGVRRINR